MNEREIQATFHILKGNYHRQPPQLIGPRCLVFAGEALRINPGWVNLREQAFPCHSPLELLEVMAKADLIRQRSVNGLNADITMYLNRQLNNHLNKNQNEENPY